MFIYVLVKVMCLMPQQGCIATIMNVYEDHKECMLKQAATPLSNCVIADQIQAPKE